MVVHESGLIYSYLYSNNITPNEYAVLFDFPSTAEQAANSKIKRGSKMRVPRDLDSAQMIFLNIILQRLL